MIGTLNENGETSFGAYSLCQPYYVAGKEYYAMLLNTRNSSNTAQNILRNGRCSINFITDSKKYFKEAVRMGFPGDKPEEKMENCLFTLEDGLMTKEDTENAYPKVISEAFQVFECTWMRELDNAQDDKAGELEGYKPPYHDFNGITSETGAHFILKIDKILMKPKYHNTIINGVKAKGFPRVPVDYGYRDSKGFWYTKFKKPHFESLPKRETNLDTVKYAADRIDDKIKFTDEACEKMLKVPRIFLNNALRSCVDWAIKNDVTLITKEHMEIINDKRSKEKKK